MEDFADSSPMNSPMQEETSPMGTESKSVGKWTDEKHGLFLKSMESMFVNQLYNSIGWHTNKNHTLLSSKRDSANPRIHHCQNSSIRKARKVQAFHPRAPSSDHTNRPVDQDSGGSSNAEVMGQNFNNEGCEGDKHVTRRINGMKRSGSSSDVGSSTDQVVPSYNEVQVNNGA